VKVFDSSALITWLRGGSGESAIREHLEGGGYCSAANWAEIAQRLPQLGVSWASGREVLLSFDLLVEPVTAPDAEAAAALWRAGARLSLADRLCLALGDRLGADIITCDAAWTDHPGVVLVR
jgi:ribonuclease VapC